MAELALVPAPAFSRRLSIESCEREPNANTSNLFRAGSAATNNQQKGSIAAVARDILGKVNQCKTYPSLSLTKWILCVENVINTDLLRFLRLSEERLRGTPEKQNTDD
jgi:hypothetical protein